MATSPTGIGTTLVARLAQQSDPQAAVTALDAVLGAARAGNLGGDQCFRRLARLWTLKRMMYYVYGGSARAST